MASRIISVLKELAHRPSAGPVAAFSYLHVAIVILLVGDEAPVGRIGLSKRLGLGEGTTRNIITHLMRARVVDNSRRGCVLTQRGKALYGLLRRKLSTVIEFDAEQLALGKTNAAVMVRASGKNVKRGIEQRDAALRAGAEGAVTILVQNREYVMPAEPEETLTSLDPLVLKLESCFHPRDNDVLIIAGAQERNLAHFGAMAAAFTLID
jgi:Mn-dependent DtxR family transcriptional regulator